MERSKFWSVDKYQHMCKRMLKASEEYPIRSHVRERFHEGFPISSEEWDTTFERLNTYERFVLLSLVETDVLLDSADYILKNTMAAHKEVPTTYEDAAMLECVPILMERLRQVSQVATDLAQSCITPTKDEDSDPLPYKLTRVTAYGGSAKTKESCLGEVAMWATLVGGCKQRHWLYDQAFTSPPLAFEVMATTPQQFNLAFFANMMPMPVSNSVDSRPQILVFDEGELDSRDTIIRLPNYSWQLSIVKHRLSFLGCTHIQRLDSSSHLFFRATEEQRDLLVNSTYWRGHKISVKVEDIHGTVPRTIRRRTSWPEDKCFCVEMPRVCRNECCELCHGTEKWPDN